MLRRLSYIVLFFCCQHCFAQPETKEQFVTEILAETPFSFGEQKVYLSDTARGWGKFDHVDSLSILNPQVNKNIPDSVLSRIITNCSFSASKKWGSIPDIKVVNTRSGKFTKLKKGTDIYRRQSFFMSDVVFDDSRTYAMIRAGRICGRYCGDSCVYFFRKVDNKWRLLLKTGCVIV